VWGLRDCALARNSLAGGFVENNIAKILVEHAVNADETLPANMGVVPKVWLKNEIAVSPPASGRGASRGFQIPYFKINSRVSMSPRNVRMDSRSKPALLASATEPNILRVSASCLSSGVSKAAMFFHSTSR